MSGIVSSLPLPGRRRSSWQALTRGAAAIAAIAVASTPLAHATPLIINQQRVDQTPPAQTDGPRGLTDQNGASPLVPAPRTPSPPPAAAPGTHIAQWRDVRISGSSLAPAALERAWRGRVGAPLNAATITAISDALNAALADTDFVKLAAQAGSRRLAQNFALRLNAQAQVSASALPPSEQFAFGGDAYGRAFPSALIQGDHGFAAPVETAFIAPDPWFPPFFQGSEAYAFVDGGVVRTNARPSLSASNESLSSAGFGARLSRGHQFTLGAELAHAIDASTAGDDGDWRVVYMLVGRR